MPFLTNRMCSVFFVGLTILHLPQAWSQSNTLTSARSSKVQPAATTPAKTDGVQWLRSASEAAVLSQKTGKPILVYVRSENCHYCDLMQKNVWQDPTTAAIIMRDMIPLKLTLEENRAAVEAMKVKGYPSTILFSPQREYIARLDGYVGPEQFLARINQARGTIAQSDTSGAIRR